MSAGRRAGWTMVDQALSSLSNFTIGVVVARNMSPDDYGAFAVGFTIYAVAIGISRAISTDPLVVRFSERSREEQAEPSGAASAVALAFGSVVGLVVLLVGLAISGPLHGVLIAFGAMLPLLLWQDSLRFRYFAERRPADAALSDGVWVCAFFALLVLPAVRGGESAAPIIVAWGLSAGAAVVVGRLRRAAHAPLRLAPGWLSSHRDLSVRFATEFLLLSGSLQFVLFATAVTSGLDETGALRGAYVLLGPVMVVAAAVTASVVPEGVRLRRVSMERFRLLVLVVAGLLATAVAGWGAVASVLPDSVGTALLGSTWPRTQPVMLWLGIATAGSAAATGLTAGLRALGAARRSLRATVPMALLVVLGGGIGGYVAGARGAAMGMIGPTWLGASVFLVQFLRAHDESARSTDDPSIPTAPPL